MRLPTLALAFLAALAAFVAPARAQEAATPAPQIDILEHILDSHHLEIPFTGRVFELPRWQPVHVGPLVIDLSPTKHVVMLLIAASLCLFLMAIAAFAGARQMKEGGHTRGLAGVLETMVLFVRNEVVLPNVGPHGERYAPFVITLFFFVLAANLLGMIPYLSTATGNIAVTATLALITFFVVEGATLAALGTRYIWTIVYWPHDMSLAIKLPMTIIMTPIELISKLTKPFALMMRLFANMIAGHITLLAIIGLIFAFHSWWVVGGPVGLAIGISMLELFVAFLQAFIFALLASVFIGLGRQSAH